MIVLLNALSALKMSREPLVTFEYLDAVLRVIHLEETADGDFVLVTKPLRISFRDLVCLQFALLGKLSSRAYLNFPDGRKIKLSVLVESAGTITPLNQTVILRGNPEGIAAKLLKKEYLEARLCDRV